MKDFYLYGAIFSKEDIGYSVSFPDLEGCFTEGDSLEEAINMAKDALGGYLYITELDNEEIPKATNLEDIKLNKGEFTVPIEVYMPTVRNELNNKSTKKTVTLPAWLNERAMKENINFSQVLQVGLKNILGINNKEIREREIIDRGNMSFEMKAEIILTMLNKAMEEKNSVIKFKFVRDIEEMKNSHTVDVIAVVEDDMLKDIEHTPFTMSDKFYEISREVISKLDLEECVIPKNNTGNTFSFILVN